MAPNSHDAAHEASMGGLIRRGLSSAGDTAENCPDPDIVAAYYERSLDANERTQFETHLSRCVRCREQVAAMVRADDQPEAGKHRVWFWDWRLIGAAVAALLVLTIWGVRRSPIAPVAKPDSNQPLVAMSAPNQPPQRQVAPPGQVPEAQQAAPAEEPLAAPKSLDRAKEKPESGPEEENRQNANGSKDLSAEKESGATNVRSSDAMSKANNTADLKKQSTNEMAAAAPAPSAPPSPMSASAPPAESTAKSTSASADARMQHSESNAPVSGVALGGLAAQAAEQRSGSTIIQTPDSKILWRIVSGTFVERTENGGATWHGQAPATDAQFNAGSAPSTKACWLVGRSGAIVVTKDAVHWKKIPPPIPADFVAVAATSDSAATIVAADGQKFATRNQGKKWVPSK